MNLRRRLTGHDPGIDPVIPRIKKSLVLAELVIGQTVKMKFRESAEKKVCLFHTGVARLIDEPTQSRLSGFGSWLVHEKPFLGAVPLLALGTGHLLLYFVGPAICGARAVKAKHLLVSRTTGGAGSQARLMAFKPTIRILSWRPLSGNLNRLTARTKQSMHPRRPTEIFGLFAATTVLPGVGPKLAAAIEKRIGAHVIDLLRHLPIGLIDRRARPPLGDVTEGGIATFEVLVVKHDKPPPGTRRPWRVITENETGRLEIIFFHARDDYVSRMLPAGERRIVSGRVEIRQGKPQMPHPDHIIRPEDCDEMPEMEKPLLLKEFYTTQVKAIK